MQEDKREEQDREFQKNISLNTFMSLPFLSINFYDTVFFAIYMIITIGLFIYKTKKYPFPGYAVSMGGVILALFAISHYLRYRIAKVSIAEKQSSKIISYMLVTLFLLPLYVFQLRLQTYVLLADFLLNWIGIGLTIAEILCGCWVFYIFRKKNAK